MRFWLPTLILASVLVAAIAGFLVFRFSSIQNIYYTTSKSEPYIKGLEKTTDIKIGLYPGTSDKRVFQMYTGNVKSFHITVKNFSDKLLLASLSGELIEKTPYNLSPSTWDPEAQFAVWGLNITTPSSIHPGEYSISLAIKVSNSLSSKEYSYIIRVIVEPLKDVLPLKSCLIITLDKEAYFQGEVIQITIKNLSNQTVWFTDTACNLYFEKFNDNCWEFYDAMIGGAAITPLQPKETKQFTWRLGNSGRPYPPGRYRVGTKGVYAEFKVLEAEPSLAELKSTLIKFLDTTTESIKIYYPPLKFWRFTKTSSAAILYSLIIPLCVRDTHILCVRQ